jgi:hypothetical protein
MPSSQFTPEELHQWLLALAEANRNNIWCHCKVCDAEWVSSDESATCLACGSDRVEHIPCWQFPDD